MGALANAALLMNDAAMRQWLIAAGAYQARVVYTEDPATPDHAVRLLLAKDVLMNPSFISDRLLTLICTDPVVANMGSTASAVGENTCLAKVAELWTLLAQWTHGDAVVR